VAAEWDPEPLAVEAACPPRVSAENDAAELVNLLRKGSPLDFSVLDARREQGRRALRQDRRSLGSRARRWMPRKSEDRFIAGPIADVRHRLHRVRSGYRPGAGIRLPRAAPGRLRPVRHLHPGVREPNPSVDWLAPGHSSRCRWRRRRQGPFNRTEDKVSNASHQKFRKR
jgi:hypothetical protein